MKVKRFCIRTAEVPDLNKFNYISWNQAKITRCTSSRKARFIYETCEYYDPRERKNESLNIMASFYLRLTFSP